MTDPVQASSAMLAFTCLPLFAGATAVLALRARAAERVGRPIHRAIDGAAGRGPGRRRALGLAGLALLAVASVVTPGVSTVFALLVLAAVASLLLASPVPGDTVVGTRGVRAGFLACSMERLDEWRLTGEHLRWRLGERWYACDLPKELHEETRAQLQGLAPGRESRFAH